MLNPRAYLEDCVLHGLNGLWMSGMPWELVNNAIDNDFNYNVSPECKSAWENIIGRKWDNTEDPMAKTLKCPSCSKAHQVPWTTTSLPEDCMDQEPGFAGEGYGDGNFSHKCSKCQENITRELLEVRKFVKDARELLYHHRPMPGTILDNGTGIPTRLPEIERIRIKDGRTFPNRLIKKNISKFLELLQPKKTQSMESVRLIIEEALRDNKLLKEVEGVTGRDAYKRYRLGSQARAHVRKMMSRYWGNPSPFALDLSGAVLRQGIFTEKMHKVCPLLPL